MECDLPSQKPTGNSVYGRQTWDRWCTTVVALSLSLAVLSLAVLGVTVPQLGDVFGKTPLGAPADEIHETRSLQPQSGTTSRWGKRSPLRKAAAAVSSQHQTQRQGLEIVAEGKPSSSPDAETGASAWKGAGGEFGLSADWREAIQERRDGDSAVGEGGDRGWDGVRGEACMTGAKREEVREVLERRAMTSSRKKVAVCLRTKDYARFLPEWLAFHYAIGVDEVSIYDDESADNTTAVIQPFVEAGFVRYVFQVISRRSHEMDPLNHCLRYYEEQKQADATNAPSFILFHDTDEYIFPLDTSLTILQALEKHHDVCCVQVPRIQYGSGGFSEMPRGLMLEKFLSHQAYSTRFASPKVMVNLEPTESEPASSHLRSPHNAQGCICHAISRTEIRINHYLGSHGDYMDRLSRYWPDVIQSSRDMDAAHRFTQRDKNDMQSDTVTHWACATREILFRVVQGLGLETGQERKGR